MHDTTLLGRAKELEVAGALVRNGIYVYYPLVDTGADLVAGNRSGSMFIPVQVKFRSKDPALFLRARDIERARSPRMVMAFVIGQESIKRMWFVPYSAWLAKAHDPKSRDGGRYINVRKNEDWLTKYEGDNGLKHAFARLLK